MAKILIEFDTVTKLATASMDGVAIPNLSSVGIYQRYQESDDDPVLFSCSVQSMTEDEEHKTTKVESVYASEQTSPKEKIAKDIEEFLSK